MCLNCPDKYRVQKMKTLISIGDILVSVNERIVLEEPFNSVVALMEILMLVNSLYYLLVYLCTEKVDLSEG